MNSRSWNSWIQVIWNINGAVGISRYEKHAGYYAFFWQVALCLLGVKDKGLYWSDPICISACLIIVTKGWLLVSMQAERYIFGPWDPQTSTRPICNAEPLSPMLLISNWGWMGPFFRTFEYDRTEWVKRNVTLLLAFYCLRSLLYPCHLGPYVVFGFSMVFTAKSSKFHMRMKHTFVRFILYREHTVIMRSCFALQKVQTLLKYASFTCSRALQKQSK